MTKKTYVDHSDGFPHEGDVFAALDFLVSIEPDPPPETRADWDSAIAPYNADIARAVATIRAFAEQTEPLTLEALRNHYYDFVNASRYRVSRAVQGIVTGYLNQAWNGVGPWRR